jgi:hypothetical protein
MADFLTRLAERTLGVAPVVRPLIPPRFAPETAPYPLELEWEVETPPPDEPDERRAPRTREAPPQRSTPARRTRNTAVGRREDQGVAPPAPQPDEAPTLPEAPHLASEARPPDSLPDPRPEEAPPRPAATATERDDTDRLPPPTEEKRKEPQEIGAQARSQPPEVVQREAPETSAGRSGKPVEMRSGEEEVSSPAAPGRPRRTARVSDEMRQPYEAGRERDEGVAFAPSRGATRGSLVTPPESAPIRGASYPDDPAAEPVERVRLLPRVVPKWGEVPASEVSAHTRAMPEPSLAVSRTVGYAADVRQHRGLPDPAPPEAPPITVSIGRVEVRAVPPAPEPPRRQAAPPAGVSLDDYLRSRDGERP